MKLFQEVEELTVNFTESFEKKIKKWKTNSESNRFQENWQTYSKFHGILQELVLTVYNCRSESSSCLL